MLWRWLLRLRCAATLGHDPLFGDDVRVSVNGWWYYPCRKCGVLMLPSIWGGVDQPSQERDA
jgi:hypothetical protein